MLDGGNMETSMSVKKIWMKEFRFRMRRSPESSLL